MHNVPVEHPFARIPSRVSFRIMSYRQRITVSATLSVALNIALLALPWSASGSRMSPSRPPIVLNLEPESPVPPPEPPPQQPPQAIETSREATRPVEDTNLLSDKNANAGDLELHDGAQPGPRVQEASDLVSVPLPPPRPATESSESSPREPDQTDHEEKDKSTLTEAKPDLPVSTEGDNDEEAANEAPRERTLLARAEPAATSDAPQQARGRIDGRVMEQGFVGFEAIRDEVAAYYLKHVKPLIRRNWITNMLARYSGVTRAVAEVEMAISPDGSLAYAEIRGKPSNRIFAALCKLSIEQAAPFKPFPFRVPPEYRDQNLVVHCTFHWQ